MNGKAANLTKARTAAVLSIIPGVGQIYAGALPRGIGWMIFFVLQIAVFSATERAHAFLPWYAFKSMAAAQAFLYSVPWMVLLWALNIWDACKVGQGKRPSIVWPALVISALNFGAGWRITEINLRDLAAGLPHMKHIVTGLILPDIVRDEHPSPVFLLSLKLIVDTIYLSLIGTVLPIPITLLLSVLGARNLMSGNPVTRVIYGLSRSAMNLLRSIEVIIIAVMLTVAVGIGPFAGVLALAIHGIGAQGKLYSEAIEDIDAGPVEAITATGANWIQKVLYGVLPQVTPQFIAFTMYRWDINVRMATVIGLVGGGGIGYTLYQYINTLQWKEAGTAIWLIAAAVILMDWASAVVREKYA